MWRTKRGRTFLKNLAKRERFWRGFANFGIGFCFVTMLFMTILIILNAWFIAGLTPAERSGLPLGIEFLLAIPGVNPILPLEYLGYVILAFIVAIVVHEFSHGILTFVGKLKVKSLGILYLIVPIGAFCEPDEEALKKAPTRPRMRIYAAGPTANFVIVIISLLLFSFIFMAAVQPVADGIVVVTVGEDSLAEEAGIEPGVVITHINDTRITSAQDYRLAMNLTTANQTINITYIKQISVETQVRLSDMYPYTEDEIHKGKGYLRIHGYTTGWYLPFLQNPLGDIPNNFLFLYVVPLYGYFQGFNPIAAPFTDSYEITGPISVLPDSIFWIIVNSLYWIFWLNFAVAIFNVLPMVPLDGGFLFNDALGSLVKRVKKGISDEQREKIMKNVMIVISLLILVLILLPFLLKFIDQLLGF